MGKKSSSNKIKVTVLAAIILASTVNATASALPRLKRIAIRYYTLKSGLRVILSPDADSKFVAVEVQYRIGFETEPYQYRGYAHLLEHVMGHYLEKGEETSYIQPSGGMTGAWTRGASTQYFVAVGADDLERVLELDAAMMSPVTISSDVLTSEKKIIHAEYRQLIENRAFGGLLSISVPQAAYKHWHDPYAIDSVDAASVSAVQRFHDDYYLPSNAALSVVGNFSAPEVMRMIRKLFGSIVMRPYPEECLEECSELYGSGHKVITDTLSTASEVAVSYPMPRQWSADFYSMLVIDELLLQQNDSLLRRSTAIRSSTSAVAGGINPLGTFCDYAGPMLWTVAFTAKPGKNPGTILKLFDSMIASFTASPPTNKQLNYAKLYVESRIADMMAIENPHGRADALASLALFQDAPDRFNKFLLNLSRVSRERVLITARKVFSADHQTVLFAIPASQHSKEIGESK